MTAVDVGTRLDTLTRAAGIAARYGPDELSECVDDLVARARERRALGAEMTVVAFAGSTGSGKSSLFNAVAGLDLAETGVRRPTTSEVLACVWGEHDTGPLLDWVGVPARRRVTRLSVLDAPYEAHAWADGLVLLDLPDDDSVAEQHRVAVDRLLPRVDAVIWVTDPVKYADALLHEQYLAPLRRHGGVLTVVLNKVDQLSVADQALCLEDLSRLTAADGVAAAPVLAASAHAGTGLTALTQTVERVVRARSAVEERLAADLAALVSSVDGGSARDEDRPPQDRGDPVAQVLDALDGENEPPTGNVYAVLQGYVARATASLPQQWRGTVQREVGSAIEGLPGEWDEAARTARQAGSRPQRPTQRLRAWLAARVGHSAVPDQARAQIEARVRHDIAVAVDEPVAAAHRDAERVRQAIPTAHV